MTDHNLALTVVAKSDNLEIKITEMSGNTIVKAGKPVTEGKNDMNFYLPGLMHGQYILCGSGKVNGVATKKIFVQ